ncbi:MAG: DUF6599 family protein [Pseudomonadota bacterium]
MRYIVFTVLLLVPITLAGWVARRGHRPLPHESAHAASEDDHWHAREHGPGHGLRDGNSDGRESSPGNAREGRELGRVNPDVLLPAKPESTLLALFKSSMAGAKVKGQVVLYDEKTLFDYIDGAAPLYLDRRFRILAAAEMDTAEGGEMTCDIYDMTAAEHAQSIFATERSPNAAAIASWPEALTGAKSFVFHKGRFYVKLTAFDSRAENALPEIAQVLRERLP